MAVMETLRPCSRTDERETGGTVIITCQIMTCDINL